jgi:hypothetical protein
LASSLPSRKTLVGTRVSGPRRESTVAVVNSFMFEASERWWPGALAQTTLPDSASTIRSPLAAPPP